MPQRPMKVCSQPGCGKVSKGRFCDPHQRAYDTRRDAERGTSAERDYGTVHRAMRLRVLREEPNCRRCGKPSTNADHIVPKAHGGTNARSNYQGLCRTCNTRKGAKRDASQAFERPSVGTGARNPLVLRVSA